MQQLQQMVLPRGGDRIGFMPPRLGSEWNQDGAALRHALDLAL
jgi:hypothetical protein